MEIEPASNVHVYFVSSEPNLCFRIYDKRGLGITSQRADDLVRIRETFDEWILEFD